ncbi:MAG: hypothetical protein HY232_07930 [Acidobacteria bacterium]|nr:hypothetical protein [Acidobacteriota bacterium]
MPVEIFRLEEEPYDAVPSLTPRPASYRKSVFASENLLRAAHLYGRRLCRLLEKLRRVLVVSFT